MGNIVYYKNMKVIATTLVKHNGNYYQVGEEIKGITESEAAKLLAANSARVEGANVKPEAPVNADELQPDKNLEDAETARVAALPISITLGKEKLRGIALANGLKVEKTATPSEIYKMIKEHREKEGIVIEDVKPVAKPKAKNPHAPKKEDVKAAEEVVEDEGDEGKGEGSTDGAPADTTTPPAGDEPKE